MGLLRTRSCLAAGGLLGLGLLGAAALHFSGSARAAFPGRNGLIVFNSDRSGSDAAWTVGPGGGSPTELVARAGQPEWSQNGKKVVFTRQGQSTRHICTARADGSHVHCLTSGDFDVQPVFSPNGRRIAFVRDTTPGKADIYVMNADGSRLHRITRSPATDQEPDWSPGGKRIVYENDRSGQWQIFTIHPDGTHRTQVTDNTNWDDQEPDFSPIRNVIAIDSTRSGHHRIWLIRGDGSDYTRVTKGSDDQEPAFSPNGHWLAFWRYTGSDELFKIKIDGQDEKQLTHSIGAGIGDTSPDWQPR